jgi:hypothetical protein
MIGVWPLVSFGGIPYSGDAVRDDVLYAGAAPGTSSRLKASSKPRLKFSIE